MAKKNRKIDRLWDAVYKLSEDDNARGSVSYSHKDDHGTGEVFITVDGVRYSVLVARADEALEVGA